MVLDWPHPPRMAQGLGTHTQRVLLVGPVGHLPPTQDVHHGCEARLWWPLLSGLQDPALGLGCFPGTSIIFLLLAGPTWACFLSPFLSPAPHQLHGNKSWPCRSCLSLCSQLPITHAWMVCGTCPTGGPATQNAAAFGLPAAGAGSGSMHSSHYQPEPDVWGGNLPKENCTLAFPRNAVCVIVCF